MGVCADDLTVSVPKLFFGYATGTNLLFPSQSAARLRSSPNDRQRKRCLK